MAETVGARWEKYFIWQPPVVNMAAIHIIFWWPPDTIYVLVNYVSMYVLIVRNKDWWAIAFTDIHTDKRQLFTNTKYVIYLILFLIFLLNISYQFIYFYFSKPQPHQTELKSRMERINLKKRRIKVCPKI